MNGRTRYQVKLRNVSVYNLGLLCRCFRECITDSEIRLIEAKPTLFKTMNEEVEKIHMPPEKNGKSMPKGK